MKRRNQDAPAEVDLVVTLTPDVRRGREAHAALDALEKVKAALFRVPAGETIIVTVARH